MHVHFHLFKRKENWKNIFMKIHNSALFMEVQMYKNTYQDVLYSENHTQNEKNECEDTCISIWKVVYITYTFNHEICLPLLWIKKKDIIIIKPTNLNPLWSLHFFICLIKLQ